MLDKNYKKYMYLQSYKSCVYCGSKRLENYKHQKFLKNFYIEAITADLGISDKVFKKMRVYQCEVCKNIQNNPWFSKRTAKKIFSQIYGQHNRNWSNAINFFNKNKLPNHGELFQYLKNKIKIKDYVEFNSPFMGLMLNIFNDEYKINPKFNKDLFSNTLNYLASRQVAGKPKNKQKLLQKFAIKFQNKSNLLKKKYLIKKFINKYLLTDNSYLAWGENDNLNSVNSKTFASNLMDMEIIDINEMSKNMKFDLFGIFHTLDHTHQPKKILDLALKTSKYVIVYCHIDRNLEKQHLFSLSREFLEYLNSINIYTKNLTQIINKKSNIPELYFLCSKNKINF
ncbi:hypothetical protein OAS85_02255 [Candidatus Pelagibacter sp.]|nr:hypothetical protein [Candidatus Pelagibacter sp.]